MYRARLMQLTQLLGWLHHLERFPRRAASKPESAGQRSADEQMPPARHQLVDLSRRTMMLVPLCFCAAAVTSGPASADGSMPDPANSCFECDGTGIVPCELGFECWDGRRALWCGSCRRGGEQGGGGASPPLCRPLHL